jgi:phospholipid transport system substrate-binding protein
MHHDGQLHDEGQPVMTESLPTMRFSLSRRRFLGATAALAVLGLATTVLGTRPAFAQGSGADTFVRNFADELLAIVNGQQSTAAKRAALQPVIDQNVDVATIARFCLGRFWNSATPAQQAQYTQLFHQVLLNNISGHLGEYRGVKFTMTGSHSQGADVLVGTIITRPNEPDANVQWVVSTSSGSPKVVDVVAEGTSLRLTQRQDYASYLGRHGNDIDKLLAALQRQLNSQ